MTSKRSNISHIRPFLTTSITAHGNFWDLCSLRVRVVWHGNVAERHSVTCALLSALVESLAALSCLWTCPSALLPRPWRPGARQPASRQSVGRWFSEGKDTEAVNGQRQIASWDPVLINRLVLLKTQGCRFPHPCCSFIWCSAALERVPGPV